MFLPLYRCTVALTGSGADPNHSTRVENARCRSEEASSYSRADRLSAAGPADGADYAIISQSKGRLLFFWRLFFIYHKTVDI